MRDRDRVTGKANSLSKGAGAGAGTGAEPQHLKSHGANSGESPAGRATRLRVASRQEKGRAQTQGVWGTDRRRKGEGGGCSELKEVSSTTR